MIFKAMLAAILSLSGAALALAKSAHMGTFINSANPGNGAELGGLHGRESRDTHIPQHKN